MIMGTLFWLMWLGKYPVLFEFICSLYELSVVCFIVYIYVFDL